MQVTWFFFDLRPKLYFFFKKLWWCKVSSLCSNWYNELLLQKLGMWRTKTIKVPNQEWIFATVTAYFSATEGQKRREENWGGQNPVCGKRTPPLWKNAHKSMKMTLTAERCLCIIAVYTQCWELLAFKPLKTARRGPVSGSSCRSGRRRRGCAPPRPRRVWSACWGSRRSSRPRSSRTCSVRSRPPRTWRKKISNVYNQKVKDFIFFFHLVNRFSNKKIVIKYI